MAMAMLGDDGLPLQLLTLTLCATLCVWYVVSFHVNGRASKRRCAPPLPPGPSGWPVLGNLPQLGAKPHQRIHEWSRTYGPTLRLRFGSADVVVAGSAAVAEQFLRTHDANFRSRPPNSGGEHMAYNYQDLVFAPYGPRWRARRKICAVHLFSTRALDDSQAIREQEAAVMVRRTTLGAAALVDVGHAANVCTTNSLTRALVGRRVFGHGDGEGEGEGKEFREILLGLLEVGGVFNVGDFMPALRWLDPQGVVSRMKRLHRRYDDMMDRIIGERRARSADKPSCSGEGELGKVDLLGLLVAMMEEDQQQPVACDGDDCRLTDTDIKALLLNLLVAGTDTTSTTVEWAMAELIRHPDILEQAKLELDTVVGRERLVSESDLPSLPFLNAVVKETFRLHPPTPLSLPRIAAEACEVAGHRVPKGAALLVNVWGIARDPDTWSDPLRFRPDRFMPGGSHDGVQVYGSGFELIPFGAGRRACAGAGWGLRMVALAVATLAHAFDWTLPNGVAPHEVDMEEAFGLLLPRAHPLMLRPHPRLQLPAYIYN